MNLRSAQRKVSRLSAKGSFAGSATLERIQTRLPPAAPWGPVKLHAASEWPSPSVGSGLERRRATKRRQFILSVLAASTARCAGRFYRRNLDCVRLAVSNPRIKADFSCSLIVGLADRARRTKELHADLRCDLAVGFFAAASFTGFFPSIGISISFWPAALFFGFLAGFFVALVSAAAPPTLLRSASIRSP